jgi:hypothetical protein
MINTFKVKPYGAGWKAVQVESVDGKEYEVRKAYHHKREEAEKKLKQFINEFWS